VRPSYNVFVAPTIRNADIAVEYTFQRAFFSQFLAHLIKEYVEGKLDLRQLLNKARKDIFHLGFKGDEGTMPFDTSIFKLARAYPQVSYPKPPRNRS
jgi:hypothetical protein